MIYLLAFVTLVLAVARATRVIVFDEIGLPLRNWVLRRYGADSKTGKLVRCYWCSGFWVSALFCLLASTAAPWPDTGRGWVAAGCWYVMATCAVSYGAAWVLDKEGTDGV